MAGLYDIWKDPNTGEELYTYAIITTDATKGLNHIHHRMPVIFSTEEEVEMWINCKKNSPSDAIPVLDQHSKSIASLLEAYQVPILVNSVKNDSPQCIVRLDEWKTKRRNC